MYQALNEARTRHLPVFCKENQSLKKAKKKKAFNIFDDKLLLDSKYICFVELFGFFSGRSTLALG